MMINIMDVIGIVSSGLGCWIIIVILLDVSYKKYYDIPQFLYNELDERLVLSTLKLVVRRYHTLQINIFGYMRFNKYDLVKINFIPDSHCIELVYKNKKWDSYITINIFDRQNYSSNLIYSFTPAAWSLNVKRKLFIINTEKYDLNGLVVYTKRVQSDFFVNNVLSALKKYRLNRPSFKLLFNVAQHLLKVNPTYRNTWYNHHDSIFMSIQGTHSNIIINITDYRLSE